MAKTYNTLSTVSAGSVLTATAYNEAVENSNNYRVPPMCVVRRSSDVNPYTSYANISWSDAIHDTDGMFSAGTPTRVTIQTAGVYLINLHVFLTGAATITSGEGFVLVNGTGLLDTQHTSYGTTGLMYDLTGIAVLSASQYLEAGTGINGGSAYILKGSTAYSNVQTRLSVTWLGQVS